ncbi:MAG: 16S rRNA (uracil(1498)-N(3))-methyltransferase [Paludibacteraceae bacterium]|nr:16S rRNA (uracil(1498)-N(3))-methyltransferase [Paludibacteraceae bacterium]
MKLFYAPDLEETLTLSEEESLHCAKVLRLTSGDEVFAFDGKGTFFKLKILNPHPKHTEVEILEKNVALPKDYRIHVAIAPTKNIERFEWFLEKCTEIGIDEITPILCQFSERKIIKKERLEKILISAAKQSLKATVPILNELCSINDVVKNRKEEYSFIAHCYKQEKNDFLKICPKQKSILILIGPEGDFSPSEVENAISLGFVPVSLGESRLRTETAGIVACHIANLVQQLG